MKKCYFTIIILFILSLLGCGKTSETSKEKVVKLGINGDENPIWEKVRDELKKDGIDLKIITFSDYVRPNLALEEKELDINAFQTEVYFDTFKKEHKLNIQKLGYTLLPPMAIYSKKIKNIKDIPENAVIAVPNDVSNKGRALLLLQDSGLIKVDPKAGLFPSKKDIIYNPKNIEIYELVATQIPRSLDDVTVAVINNGVAVEAGFSPLKDSLFIENVKNPRLKPYFNIIAARQDNINNPEIKKVLEVYQTDKIKKVIIDYYKGATVPVF